MRDINNMVRCEMEEEIETLREKLSKECAASIKLMEELAALKAGQGKPFAYESTNRVSGDKKLGYGKVTSAHDETLYSHIALCTQGTQAEAKLEVMSWGQGKPFIWISLSTLALSYHPVKNFIPLFTQATTIPPKMVISSYRQKPVSMDFVDGWNACRDLVLSVAPQPQEKDMTDDTGRPVKPHRSGGGQ